MASDNTSDLHAADWYEHTELYIAMQWQEHKKEVQGSSGSGSGGVISYLQ